MTKLRVILDLLVIVVMCLIAESAAADVGVDTGLVCSVVAFGSGGRGGSRLRGHAERHGVRDSRVSGDAAAVQRVPVYVPQRDSGPVHIDAATADPHTPASGASLRLSQSSRLQPARRPLGLQRLGTYSLPNTSSFMGSQPKDSKTRSYPGLNRRRAIVGPRYPILAFILN